MEPNDPAVRHSCMRIPTKVAVLLAIMLSITASCGGSSGEIAAPVDGMTMRYGTVTERDVDSQADGKDATAAIASLNEFAVDFYHEVATPAEGNVIFSPYSAAFTLSMLYGGASGQTADEIAGVLHIQGEAADWHEGLNAYDMSLDARVAGSDTDWATANKVWLQSGLDINTDYLDLLTGAYGSPLAEADFGADADAEREIINEWVGENTSGLIDELFKAGTITPNTVMVLVNAIALDAPWEFPFDPESTGPGDFQLEDGSVVQVPMMHYDEFLPSGSGEGYQAVELPYGDGALSMIVIVPEDFQAFESQLSVEQLDDVVASIQPGGIHLSMPSFSVRSDFDLNEHLTRLGMESAFNGGDFSAMIDGVSPTLSFVVQEAYIEVDEEGTRAAAATGASMAVSHGPWVEVNKPFIYLVRDQGAGTILFMGKVLDPSE